MAARWMCLAELLDNILDETLPDEDNDGEFTFIVICALLGKRTIPKLEGMVEKIVPQMEDLDFRHHFRLSRSTVERLIQDLGPRLASEHHGGFEPLSIDKQVLIFVWYMSNQSSMRGDSLMFDVCKKTVHKMVHKVAAALCTQCSRYIHWPDADRQRHISRAIQDQSRLRRCIGILDGTHIRIIHAPGQDQDYINRKGFPSILLQLVVDDLGFITDAYLGWPGATHDARVLRNSEIYARGERGELFLLENSYIIADSAYPVKTWLIPPFRDNGHLSAEQRRFNRSLSTARQTVERVIGHLKGRFRMLRHMYCVNISDTCQLILAACCLHNLCLLEDDDIDDFIDMDDIFLARNVNAYPNLQPNAQAGVFRRNAIMNEL